MNNKKLIFLDIDGTLCEPGVNTPPDSAVDAIRKAQAKGHKVFLCTGRNYNMLAPLIPYGFDGIIGSSGGYVQVGEEVIYDVPMSTGQRDYILNKIRSRGIFCTIECKNGSFTDEGFKKFLEENASKGNNSELLRWRRQIESNLNILPMSRYTNDPVYKIILMSLNADKMYDVTDHFKKGFAVTLQEESAYGLINGEIVPKGLSKGDAICRVVEYLGMTIEDTFGYGDSMNDKEMMETTHWSVCMANGSDGLKKLADEICPAVDKDGLYHSFEKNGLI